MGVNAYGHAAMCNPGDDIKLQLLLNVLLALPGHSIKHCLFLDIINELFHTSKMKNAENPSYAGISVVHYVLAVFVTVLLKKKYLLVRRLLFICLFIYPQCNSKTNDPKLFKLGIGNDLGIS